MSYEVGLPNNSYKPITNTTWVRSRLCKLQKQCTRLAAASDKAYQLLAHGRRFFPGTPASSITKTGRHDIAEILLKVALNTKNQIKSNPNIYISWKGIHIINNYLTSFLKLEADCEPWEASWLQYKLCCFLRIHFSLRVKPVFNAETSTKQTAKINTSRSMLSAWMQVNNLLSKNAYH